MVQSIELARAGQNRNLHAIDENSTVCMYFSLALEDDSVIDSNFSGKPATFTMGDGNILAGFEALLVGLLPGQTCSFLVPPENGFGEHNSENLQTLKPDQFPAAMELSVGLVVSFSEFSENSLLGVIKVIDGDDIVVDFNHPLAGKSIVFKVEILSVAQIDAVVRIVAD